ncbi:MAG: hypothetical protein KAG43_08835, partial [Candidatus Marithrix sp.]|nr:hypothetical protein [Candidatus Marithrix sp.]
MKIRTKLILSFLSLATIILIAGILGIIETNRLYSISEEVGVKNAPLADASMEIKITATTAHLWFEEIITGAEEKEVIEKVWKLLDESLWYVNAMLSGGQNTEGVFYPVDDQIMETKLLSVKTDILKFKEIAQLRFENNFGKKELQDQALDDKFDKLFDGFINKTDEVEGMLHIKIRRDIEIMRKTAKKSNIILTVATLFGFIVAIIATFYISNNITTQVGGEPAEIAKITEHIAAGNLDIRIKAATGIYAAIQLMVENLKVINYEKEQQNWLKTGQSQLNENISGEQNITKLAKNIISFLTTYVDSQVGLFYMLLEEDGQQYLQIIASYAYIDQ